MVTYIFRLFFAVLFLSALIYCETEEDNEISDIDDQHGNANDVVDIEKLIPMKEKSQRFYDTAYYDDADLQNIAEKIVAKRNKKLRNFGGSSFVSQDLKLSHKEQKIFKRDVDSSSDTYVVFDSGTPPTIEMDTNHSAENSDDEVENGPEHPLLKSVNAMLPKKSMPTVQLSSQSIVGVVGGKVIVRCMGNSQNLTWSDPKKKIISSRSGSIRVSMYHGYNISDLTFDPLREDHAGIYQCTNSILKLSTTIPFHLSVPKPITPPSGTLNITSSRVSLTENDSYYVLCTANSPNVTWFRGYQVVGPRFSPAHTHYNAYSVNGKNMSILVLDHVTSNSGAEYSCNINRDGRNITYPFKLIVELPKPEVRLSESGPINRYSTQNFRLTCFGNSNEIYWKNPRNEIIQNRFSGQDPYIEQMRSPQELDLVFTNLGQYHSGRYSCVVRLSKMDKEKDFLLNVKAYPMLEFSPSRDEVILEIKEKFSINCKNIDAHNIQWLDQNRNPIKDYSGTMYIQKAHGGLNLVFSKVGYKHAGVYNCTGNVAGIPVYRTINIKVIKKQHLDKPVLSISSGEIHKKVGDTLTVKCEGDTRSLNWMAPPHNFTIPHSIGRIRTTDVILVGDDEYAVTLLIDNLEINDRGVYTCAVAELTKQKTQSFTLNVIQPAYFIDNLPREYDVNETATVVLQCGGRGYPNPETRWYKLGPDHQEHEVSGSKSTYDDKLVLQNVQYYDAGTYGCHAIQTVPEGGRVHRSMALKIRHKPVFPNGSNLIRYVYIGQILNVSCDDTSYPPAYYTWTGLDKTRITYRKPTNILTISFIDKNSYGEYICEAVNEYGSAFQHITFVESEKPDIPNLKVKMVTSDEIHLSISTYQKSISEYEVEYKKKEDPLFKSKTYKRDDAMENYILDLLNPETEYIVRALSKNIAGKSEFTQNQTIKTSSASILGSSMMLIILGIVLFSATIYPLKNFSFCNSSDKILFTVFYNAR